MEEMEKHLQHIIVLNVPFKFKKPLLAIKGALNKIIWAISNSQANVQKCNK